MAEEFNLSEKVFSGLSNSAIHTQDVKEFIRRVLEINKTAHSRHQKEVLRNKLAGRKLK